MSFSLISVLEKIRIFGNPFRGLARAGSIELDGASPPGSITKTGAGVTQPYKGATQLLQKIPPPAAPTRTPAEVIDDTSKGYTWATFSIMSGRENVVWGEEIGEFSSVYMDPGGRNWLFTWDVPSLNYNTISGTGTLLNPKGTLVREFGRFRTAPSDQPTPGSPINSVLLDEFHLRDIPEEETYAYDAERANSTVTAHRSSPVQQSSDGSKVMLIWVTNEQPPGIAWGAISASDGSGDPGSLGNGLIAYIVEVTISGTATDDIGTGITAVGAMIESWPIDYVGNRKPTGTYANPIFGPNFQSQIDAGNDGEVILNTMGLAKVAETSDMVTCTGGLCEAPPNCALCPDGRTFVGTHSETFGTTKNVTDVDLGLTHWIGRMEYESRYTANVSAYYDGLTPHFISVQNRVYRIQDYDWDFNSTMTESATMGETAPCPVVTPVTRTGSYSYTRTVDATCRQENILGQSIEVFIDGTPIDIHSVENIIKKEDVVSYTETDSSAPGDMDFDTASVCCDDCGPPADPADDIWYVDFGGSNFTLTGNKTITDTITLKLDGVNLCEDVNVAVTPLDEFSAPATLSPCLLGSTNCSTGVGGGCTGGVPTANAGCHAFPGPRQGGAGCVPEIGGIANGCQKPPSVLCIDPQLDCTEYCESVLPRGVIVAPSVRDVRTGWYLHGNRSLGYLYDVRHTACSGAVGDFNDRHLRALADGHVDLRETINKQIRSTVHPEDDRFEVSEDDDIGWV